MNSIKPLATLIVLALFFTKAYAYTWQVEAQVELVEPTYVPEFVRFRLANHQTGECANQWLDYFGKGIDAKENTKAVYSGLVAALHSGKKVKVYGNSECKIEYVHLLN